MIKGSYKPLQNQDYVMKQRLLLCIVILLCGISISYSQTYRNEWIDFSKTYYKFSVVSNGVYRINSAELPAALQSATAQSFQLWRNGVQIPIYTSVATGVLGSSDYIEFWGTMNDGMADSVMYLNTSYQTNNLVSMETDSSSYFLTVNTATSNARLTNTINDIVTLPLSPLPYFIDSLAYGFREQLWQGYAQVISGEYVLSSSYDKNEGWTTNAFTGPGGRSFTLSNLKAYKGSDAPNMQFAVTGGVDNILFNTGSATSPIYNTTDVMTTTVNGVQIDQRTVSSFDIFNITQQSSPITNVTSNDDLTFKVSTQTNNTNVYLGKYKLVYPRTFDFTGAQSFAFDLPASIGGTYLEISNFVTGGIAPILVDLTNGLRYTCVISGNLVKVKLLPSLQVSKCVLYSADPTFATHITNYTTRNFNNYSLTANQSNFIFIANNLLNSGSNNQVEAYRSYRASAAGGSYNAKTYDIDELTDQFGYGIYKHPLGLRNFLQYANAKFSVHPKFALILGHGVNFNDFYGHQGTTDGNILNMVPTWGNPASDVLLSAASLSYPVPAIPIGRISVVNNTELKAYLDKAKEYDVLQTNTINDQANKDFTKKSLFLIGSGSDVNALLSSYMQAYVNIMKDTLVGSDAQIFGQTGTNLTVAEASVKNLINNGVPLLTYFGHASLTSLDFNLNDPNDYTNTNGKYPVFSVGGCNAGNFFNYDESRISNSIYTISEKFTLAPERGALGFVSSTHFGVVNTLDYYNKQFFIATNSTAYGKSIGEINQKAFDSTWKLNTGDYFTRLTLEETTLHGDPSIKLYTWPKPDYDMEPQNISVSPTFISVADDSFKVSIKVHNLGKAINDSVKVKLQWQDPTGKTTQIGIYKIRGVHYIDSSISVKLHITGNTQQGTNYIIATLDPDNVISEIAENNNTATLAFQISPDEIRPVYPYPLSIVNTPTFKLVASTADPYQASRTYQLDMDTTELFNSPTLASTQVTQVGGEVEFTPPITSLTNNKVYYWRVAPIINGTPTNYRTSSFLYNTTYNKGWSQSHLYQQFKSSPSGLSLDSVSRQFNFGKISNSLQINNSFFFGDGIHGGIQDYDFSSSINGTTFAYGSCASAAITFFVFDTVHFKPWTNPGGGLYNSTPNNCGAGKDDNFSIYFYDGPYQRKNIMDFMNLIPNGYYVVAKMQWPALQFAYLNDSSYASVWRKDTLIYGSGQSVPDYLYAQGFTDIDQLSYPRLFNFIYKKNDQAHFVPIFNFSQSLYDKVVSTAECFSTDTVGSLASPVFGPAKAWSMVHWSGHPLETTAPFPDSVILQVIAIDKNGNQTVKFNLNRSNPDFDISSISADTYPYIQLNLLIGDSLNATPWQLDQWRLEYTPAPEGVLAPNLYSGPTSVSTTSSTNAPYKFGVAFKNVSEMTMNGLKLNLKLIDTSGNTRSIPLPNTKSLAPGDTTNIYFEIPTDTLNGVYNMYLDVNADSAQIEQYFFNNFLYKQFTVNTPLPVNFLNFQATPNAANVSLQWQVTNEAGANYYVAERSVDGITFSTIGQVAAYKNNALMNTYNLLDQNPVAGKNYYRVRIINQDGTSEYSEIRVVTFGKDNVIKIYPNPVKSVLNVSIPSAGKTITLILTNAAGQQMMQTSVLGSTQLNMGQYATGIYYLQVKDGTNSTVFRVEKQ